MRGIYLCVLCEAQRDRIIKFRTNLKRVISNCAYFKPCAGKLIKMALLKYFKSSLPTAKETGMSEIATREANAAVSRVMTPTQQTSRKRKAYSVFSDEQRATIGKYATENGNAAAVKKFKGDFDGGLGESTVRAFKKRYLEELKKATKENLPGEVPNVTKIANKRRGRPLLLGDVDKDVQTYIRALRKAGTPISAPVVLAAAEGIVTAHNR